MIWGEANKTKYLTRNYDVMSAPPNETFLHGHFSFPAIQAKLWPNPICSNFWEYPTCGCVNDSMSYFDNHSHTHNLHHIEKSMCPWSVEDILARRVRVLVSDSPNTTTWDHTTIAPPKSPMLPQCVLPVSRIAEASVFHHFNIVSRDRSTNPRQTWCARPPVNWALSCCGENAGTSRPSTRPCTCKTLFVNVMY